MRTLAYHKTDSTCFASGGRDNAILIWDTRVRNVGSTTKADNCIYSGHTGGPGTPLAHRKNSRQTPKMPANLPNSSITGLVFQDDNTLVSCGAGDGIVKVWDLRRNYSCYKREPLPKHSIPYPGTTSLKGFTNLTMDSTGQRLYVSCMDHNIYCYNLGVYATQPAMAYTGMLNSTFFVKTCLSADDQYLVSGSSDHNAFVWNIKSPYPLVKLKGHEKEVTCVAWARTNDIRIVTCCDEARHKVWRINCYNFEDANKRMELKGEAQQCEDPNNIPIGVRLKALENTPKTLKRLVERNETTPSSTEKLITKRTYSQLCAGDPQSSDGASSSGGDAKRQLIETRARRLFGPSTSSASGTSEFGIRRLLPEIAEEMPTETLASPKLLASDPTTEPNEKLLLSPLNERSNFNNFEVRTPSTSRSSSTSIALFSPTSNLPNYVVDGDAPHLKLQSPKRKLKENVDWLTKIRKQRLQSTINSHLNDRLNGQTSIQNDGIVACTSASLSALLSPQMQKLKSSDRPPFNGFSTSPTRRKSSCQQHSAIEDAKKTPSRRNSEATILRFFRVSSPTPPKKPIPSTSNN